MKLLEVWKRIGKQPLRITRQKDAIVFVNGKEYEISKIMYDNGKFIGFDTKPKCKYKWHNEKNKPEEDMWVVVKTKDGKEYNDHQWLGHAWYRFIRDKDGWDGWRTDIEDIVSWRYQE